MDNQSDHKQEPRGYKREEGVPKNGFAEDLPYRIAGLEKAKTYPEMSRQDIAALDRVIAKLRAKLAEKNGAKKEDEGM